MICSITSVLGYLCAVRIRELVATGPSWEVVGGQLGLAAGVRVPASMYMCKDACGCVLMRGPDWLRTGGVDSKRTMVDVVQ